MKEFNVNKIFEDIKKLDKAYQNGNPLIDDGSYDTMYFELLDYLNNHSEEETDEMRSYLNNAEPDITLKAKKIKHPYHIISLAKSQTIDGIKKYLSKWNNSNKNDKYYTDKFLVERKEDGLTVVLYFNDKRMPNNFIAVTRGGGKEGQDITNKVINFANLNIDELKEKIGSQHLVIRGEAMIDDDDFNNMNSNNKFANSRNAASGTLMANDPSLVKERNMKFYAYSIVNKEDFIDQGYTELDCMNLLMQLGIEVTGDINSFDNTNEGKQQLIEYIKNFDSNKRSMIGHAIDGLVIKPNCILHLDEIGYTGHHPNSDIAYKFKAEQEVAILADVKWQKSMNGKLTPIGILDHPVNILGANISKASLASIQNIEKRDIMLGDHVIIRRSNDVIPQIVGPVKELRDDSEIDIHELIPKDASRKGAILYSPVNNNNKMLESWNKFVGEDCLNLNGISLNTIKTMYKNGLIDINDYSSIYRIDRDKFISIKGLGEKTYNNLIKQLKSNIPQLSGLLLMLPAEGLGYKLANKVANTIEKINPGDSSKDLKDLAWYGIKDQNGIGNHAKEILNNLFNEDNVNRLELLSDYIPLVQNKEEINEFKDNNEDLLLNNLHFVITGKFNLKRKEIEKIINDNGGIVDGSIKKTTNYLLMNGDRISNKTKKAKQLNIPIINWDQFMNMIN